MNRTPTDIIKMIILSYSMIIQFYMTQENDQKFVVN